MDVKTTFHDDIFTIELSGVYNRKFERPYKEIWQEIIGKAKKVGARGILMLNNVDFVFSNKDALDLLQLYIDCPDLKAVANVKYILPDSEDVSVYTFMNKMAYDAGILIKTFYDKDEAVEWIKQGI